MQRDHAASLVVRAAAARPISNRHGVHLPTMAQLGFRISQRALQPAALKPRCQDMHQRLHLMCSSSPLSVVAFRLALSVDRHGVGRRVEHKITGLILRRCFGITALRLWMGDSKPRVRSVSDREIVESFTADLRMKKDQERQIAVLQSEKEWREEYVRTYERQREDAEQRWRHEKMIDNIWVATIMAGIIVFTWIKGRRSSGSL